MMTTKELYENKLEDLFASAEEHITDIIYKDADAVPALLKICYQIAFVKELRELAISDSKVKKTDAKEDKPAESIKDKLPKGVQPPKMAQQAFGGTNTPPAAPVASTPSPKAQETNQKYINDVWDTYFDSPFITIYERHVRRNGKEFQFYSTTTRTGLKMDVSFQFKDEFEAIKKIHSTIIPREFHIQSDSKKFARLFISKIARDEGDPIEVFIS